jgi:NTP pyrophosphatase (non-canonical NTP hydrolase)
MRSAELKIYTDYLLYSIVELTIEVLKENDHQFLKWGIQKRTAFEWLAYLTEEIGELSEAISEHHYREGGSERVIQEAIQVATLALKIAEMYGENNGEK